VPWLAWRNFNYFQERGRVWRRNVLGLATAIVFIFISSAALYNRAWEIFEPAEPAHGVAKLSLSDPPVLWVDTHDNLVVRLPDGRVWFDYLSPDWSDEESSRAKWLWHNLIEPLPRSTGAPHLVDGSNWRSVTAKHVDFLLNDSPGAAQATNHVVGYLDTAGIKADGTLWISDPATNHAWTGNKMNRFGNETNWQQLASPLYGVLLLKNDGTLWYWGTTNHFNWFQWQTTNWPALSSDEPHQIDTNSDWIEIYGRGAYLAKKSDGRVWKVGINENEKSRKAELIRDTNLDDASLRTLSESGNGEMAYVRPNGTLWMSWGYQQNHTNMVYSEFVQVGAETNWSAVSVNWGRLVALKSDGSLWQWQYVHLWDNDSREQLISAAHGIPTRLGIHRDWLALAHTWGYVITLAADGSLWLWPNLNYPEPEPLLKLPKQPELLGNVLSNPE
jgi:hypothetical protein